MIGCPDCTLFFTGVHENWLLLEHRATAHPAPAPPEPGPDPAGPPVSAPWSWLIDMGGRDQ